MLGGRCKAPRWEQGGRYLSACVYPFLAVCILHRQTGALFVLDRIEGLAGLEDASSNPNAGAGHETPDASLPSRLVARLRATLQSIR